MGAVVSNCNSGISQLIFPPTIPPSVFPAARKEMFPPVIFALYSQRLFASALWSVLLTVLCVNRVLVAVHLTCLLKESDDIYC